jgi:hypothetical protein
MSLWFGIVAGLLVVSGSGKLSNPSPTAGALAAAGLPGEGHAVAYLAVAEIAAGVTGLTLGNGLGGIPVAMMYTGFTVFVVAALLEHWPIQSCGCFARIDTPPSWLHVGFDVAALGGALWHVATRAESTVETAVGMGGWGFAFAGAVLAGIVVAHRLVFVLPTRLHKRSPQRA